ncbi:cupin domain-containing protein [uncultured Sphingomonas sp.]|uniref:cupin domain-containing protein n=1 Tax=uncultured Sphingomonas sp. TaxID=158754 RepID=UPI0035CC4FFF
MAEAGYDQYREDRIGRANVADTPALVDFYEDLDRLSAGALWTVANKIEPWQPAPPSVPMLWRYADLRPHVLRALELVTPEKAGRRVVYLLNPGRREIDAAVGFLYTGLQVMNAGEVASSHRHSASALRFIMEGEGAYTVVDGTEITLGANDFVLTPNGTWHEHGVREGGTACIWQDGLDIPLMNALDANFYEVHPELAQARTEPVDASTSIWGHPGLRPAGQEWSRRYSPLLRYEWARTYEALNDYARVSDGSRFDGIHFDFVNPVTGGAVMPTMGASMQMLRPGERTQAHRQVGSFVFQCARGSGSAVIGGRHYAFGERDIFCVPSWTFHEFANGSQSEDLCLFSFHDLPVIRALGLYREEAYGENDGHQPVLS